jgi:hypothetical protein
MLGGEDAAALLRQGAASFAVGDLQEASATISRATARLDAANLDGIVRSAGVVLVVAVMVMLTLRPRRRSRPTDYTAAP